MSDPFAEIAALPEPLRSRIESGVTFLLCVRFRELAVQQHQEAEAALAAAQHRLLDATSFLERTNETLADAARLYALGIERA